MNNYNIITNKAITPAQNNNLKNNKYGKPSDKLTNIKTNNIFQTKLQKK